MTRHSKTHMALCLAFALTAGSAAASGSDGGSAAETGDAAAYNKGKGVFSSKYACGACPMGGKNLDASNARELLADKKGVSLSADESAAMDVYLKRRFKL